MKQMDTARSERAAQSHHRRDPRRRLHRIRLLNLARGLESDAVRH